MSILTTGERADSEACLAQCQGLGLIVVYTQRTSGIRIRSIGPCPFGSHDYRQSDFHLLHKQLLLTIIKKIIKKNGVWT